MQLTIRLIIIYSLFIFFSCIPLSTKEYIPRQGSEYVTASWYGPNFHGRPTASGERFNMYALTCAHKRLKFGTSLRVTNPDNNQSVVVTVNDRGPFVRGRDLDLSYRAAKKIGLIEKGVGKVRIEYLERNMRYAKKIPFIPPKSSVLLTIQVGSFIEQSLAKRLKKGLELSYDDVYISMVYIKGQKFYRVRMGTFKKYNSAFSLAEKLAEEGYNIFITAKN